MLALEERVTLNHQVFMLDSTIEAGIPGDVVWSLIDGKHIVSRVHSTGQQGKWSGYQNRCPKLMPGKPVLNMLYYQ